VAKTLRIISVWAVVVVPLAYGLWNTLQNAAQLFGG